MTARVRFLWTRTTTAWPTATAVYRSTRDFRWQRWRVFWTSRRPRRGAVFTIKHSNVSSAWRGDLINTADSRILVQYARRNVHELMYTVRCVRKSRELVDKRNKLTFINALEFRMHTVRVAALLIGFRVVRCDTVRHYMRYASFRPKPTQPRSISNRHLRWKNRTFESTPPPRNVERIELPKQRALCKTLRALRKSQ